MEGVSLIVPPVDWARRPERLSIQVGRELALEIIQGTHPPYSTLPNEQTLCDRFGVSRTVIREALKNLEQKGLLSIRQGDGTTVQSSSAWNFLDGEVLGLAVADDATGTLRAEAQDVRAHLEAELVRAAGPRLSRNHFDAMEGFLRRMDVEDQPESLHLLDNEFHDVILRAARSPIKRSIVRHLVAESRAAVVSGLNPGRSHYQRANDEHRELLELLRNGESSAAAAVMLRHITAGHWLETRSDPTTETTA